MKRLSQLSGVTAGDAERLAGAGVRSVGDLARVQDLGTLSAGSGWPLDLLEQWRQEAREESRAARSRRRRLAASAAVILIILAVVSVFLWRGSKGYGPYSDPNEIGRWRDAARTYREARRWEEAIGAYREVVRRDPKDWDARFEIGWILIQQGEPRRQEAIDALKAAIAVAPGDDRNKWCYLNLALAYSDSGNELEADRAFTEIWRIDRDFVPGRLEWGNILSARGKWEEAKDAYERVIRLDPKNTLAYFNLYWLFNQHSNYEARDQVYQKLRSIAPDDNYTLWLQASRLEGQGDLAGAAQIYRETWKRDPTELFSLNALAPIEAQLGKTGAMEMVQSELARNPSWSDGYFTLGFIHQQAAQGKDLNKAKSYYLECLKLDSRHRMALNNLVSIALAEGNIEDTVQYSRRMLEINPSDEMGLGNLAYALFMKGDLKASQEAYQKALKLTPRDALLQLAYSEVLLWLGESASVHRELQAARGNVAASIESGSWQFMLRGELQRSGKAVAVSYDTPAQKLAAVNLLDGVAYLRESNVATAMERFRTVTQALTGDRAGKDAVRKTIDDLTSLRGKAPGSWPSDVGLAYLHEWMGDRRLAEQDWRSYLRSGSDPLGRQLAERALGARNTAPIPNP